jgi:DNA-binding CsgD family transcriptional regulator
MTSNNTVEMNSSAMLRLSQIQTRLLAVVAVKGLPQTQQITLLSRAGLTPKEIAELLGTTANTVRVALVGIRKAEKTGKGRLKLDKKEQKDGEES